MSSNPVNSGTTAIQTPTNNIQNHTTVLKQLKETTEVGQRLRGDPNNSYVKVGELTQAGLINLVGSQVVGAAAASSDSGAVTDVTSSTLSVTVDDGTADIELSDSGVTAGTYTTADITVDEYGRVTSASDGSGSSANITADTHPSSATDWDDEFEYGSSLDTSGSRFTGAQAWSWFNQGSSTAALASGSVKFTPPNGDSSFTLRGFTENIPSGSWSFACKYSMQYSETNNFMGLVLLDSSNKYVVYGLKGGSGFTMLTSYGASLTTAPTTIIAGNAGGIPYLAHATEYNYSSIPIYLRIDYNGTSLTFYVASDGINWITLNTVTASTYLGTLASIGIAAYSDSTSGGPGGAFDWFRRLA